MARLGLTRIVLISAALAAATLAPSPAPLPGFALNSMEDSNTTIPYHHYPERGNVSLLVSPEETYWGILPVPLRIPSPFRPSEYDIPLELNDAVWEHLMRLQRAQGRHVRGCLERAGFFSTRMKEILWEEGCPADMIHLAMIESGFSPTARSPADAAGPWQFMEGTGKNYDLKVTDWIDERLDIEKSTRAAARHLMDLYAMFENWPLVLAAYNAGPGAVQRAIRRHDTNDFWELAEFNDFRPETKAFVPRFYAYMILAKHPDRFGLINLDPMEHPYPVEIRAGPLTDLSTVSKISGAPYEQIVNLNAQYLYGCTPPQEGSWVILVPQKYSLNLQDKMDSLKPEQRNEFPRYKVRKGESIKTLARRYQLPAKIIMQANNLVSSSIKRDQVLAIPSLHSRAPPPVVREPNVRKMPSGRYAVKYTVGQGDTLWKISKMADVQIDDICEWNNIKKEDHLYPGQSVTLYCHSAVAARSVGLEGERNHQILLNGRNPSQTIYHTVKAGQSLSIIAKKYGVSKENLISWNNLKSPYRIHAGQKLKIYQ